jgi:hypothetical protein
MTTKDLTKELNKEIIELTKLQNENALSDLTPDDNEMKSFYYYSDSNTKVEIRYIKETRIDLEGNETVTMKRLTNTFFIKSYPSHVAEKVRDRLKWEKFGAISSEKITYFGEEVEIEINPEIKHLLRKSKGPKMTSDGHVINQKYYFEDTAIKENKIIEQPLSQETPPIQKENIEEIKIVSNEKLEDTINDNNSSKNIKKKLIGCRHCGSSEHWSIKCPSVVVKREEEEKIKQEKIEQDKQNKYLEEKKYRDNLQGLKVTEFDFNLSENEIKEYLNQFGKIINIFFMKNKKTREFIGVVFVTYSTNEENEAALVNIPRKAIGYTFPNVEKSQPRNPNY